MTELASKHSDGSERDDASPAGGGPTTIAFEDTALVDRCRKGDMEAFAGLVARYQDRIFNLILRMCGRRADAEELAQETFLKALEKIGQFRGHSRFYTWLFRIAANLAISHRRRSGKIRFVPLGGPGDLDGSQAAALTAAVAQRRDPPPDAAALSAEVRHRVTRALEQLNDDARLVVILADMEDMDYAHIAEVMSVPEGTVKSRLHRARRLLQGKLADLVGG